MWTFLPTSSICASELDKDPHSCIPDVSVDAHGKFDILSAVKQPPLITVKLSLKHFREQAFLIDLARVSWKDIDLILSVEDAWLFFKRAFLTILNKQKNVEPGTDIALGSLQT